MTRLQSCFDNLQLSSRKALIPYITAGDPDCTQTLALMHAMVDAGADVIELGVPFSDPMADGPSIQLAHERALASGTTLRKVLDVVQAFRSNDSSTPVVLMGYLNPVEHMGYAEFARAARQAGVDGVLLVDLAVDEAGEAVAIMREQQLSPIFLLAPTSPQERVRKVAALASGYVYYVSVKGVTGSSALDTQAVAAKLTELRQDISLPIAVGFGIRDAAAAAAVAQCADGVIVGSALVNRIDEFGQHPAQMLAQVAGLLKDMRSAMDRCAKD